LDHLRLMRKLDAPELARRLLADHDTTGTTAANMVATQVCVSGCSRSVRYVTTAVREQVFAAYRIGYPPPAGAYELDHLIPLELSGDTSASNLWPQPYHGANSADVKDHLENHLHTLVCSGQVELGTAQQAMAGDWRMAAARYGSTTAVASPSITTSTSSAPSRTEAPVSAGNRATARCNDGTYSYAAHHQGACSHHGGVAEFYK